MFQGNAISNLVKAWSLFQCFFHNQNARVLLAVTDRVTTSADASVMQVTLEVNVTAVLADITDSLTASVSRCMWNKLANTFRMALLVHS